MSRAVQYVANTGQTFRGRSGRVFTLNHEGGRIELIEQETGERFILVEHYGCLPSAELVHKIGTIAVGEDIVSFSKDAKEQGLKK